MSSTLPRNHFLAERARLADLATYPSLTSFLCSRVTMTVWLVAALSLFEIQAFEDSDADTKSKWQLSCLLTVCCCLHVAKDGRRRPASIKYVDGRRQTKLPLMWKAEYLNIIWYVVFLPSDHSVLRIPFGFLDYGKKNLWINLMSDFVVSRVLWSCVVSAVSEQRRADVCCCWRLVPYGYLFGLDAICAGSDWGFSQWIHSARQTGTWRLMPV